MFEVRRWSDARAFRARAGSWLLAAEDEHNLLLGVLDRLDEHPLAHERPIYLATVESAGEVVGCAYRTPPYKLGLCRMPPGAADALAEDVARFYPHVPVALAPEAVALRFGARYAELRGTRARLGRRQRLYRADAVIPPVRRAPGRARPAAASDAAVVDPWYEEFHREVGSPAPPAGAAVARARAGGLWLWEDGAPQSLAGWAARTRRWARVAYVYTPPDRRGRGYATALVADLTSRLLAAGVHALLYADLGNPAANAIYAGIGYRPLGDLVDVEVE